MVSNKIQVQFEMNELQRESRRLMERDDLVRTLIKGGMIVLGARLAGLLFLQGMDGDFSIRWMREETGRNVHNSDF